MTTGELTSMPYSGNYPGADVRATLNAIHELLRDVDAVFVVLEQDLIRAEADDLGRDLSAARGACLLAARVVAEEATERTYAEVRRLR